GVSGTPPLSYQWLYNGTNLAGATSAALTLTNVQFANAGNYSVRVTNAAGSALSSNAVLAVTPLPACLNPPPGLVSWWKAESSAADQLGGNNGTLYGNATYAEGR